jgi:hypothetical protein
MALKWFSKKEVTMLSRYQRLTTGMGGKVKRYPWFDYNNNMGAVDTVNQMLNFTSSWMHKTQDIVHEGLLSSYKCNCAEFLHSLNKGQSWRLRDLWEAQTDIDQKNLTGLPQTRAIDKLFCHITLNFESKQLLIDTATVCHMIRLKAQPLNLPKLLKT